MRLSKSGAFLMALGLTYGITYGTVACAAGNFATVTEFGPGFYGNDLNDVGQVVGYSQQGRGGVASLWQNGVTTQLPTSDTLANYTFGVHQGIGNYYGAFGNFGAYINNAGQILGGSRDGSDYMAVWYMSNPTSTPVLLTTGVIGSSNVSTTSAMGLSSDGQALVNSYSRTVANGPVGLTVDILYLNGATTTVSSGDSASIGCYSNPQVNCGSTPVALRAVSINGSGQVLFNDSNLAAGGVDIWQNGVTTQITTGFFATALNNNGAVVGIGNNGNAILWNGTNQISLGVGRAEAINDAGVVVGSDPLGTQALVWLAGATSPVTLNSLVDPTLGWDFTDAYKINNADQILAWGTQGTSTKRTSVLINLAVPEAQTYAILLVGLGLLPFLRRRASKRR